MTVWQQLENVDGWIIIFLTYYPVDVASILLVTGDYSYNHTD